MIGATGKTGRQVTDALVARGALVRAASRKPGSEAGNGGGAGTGRAADAVGAGALLRVTGVAVTAGTGESAGSPAAPCVSGAGVLAAVAGGVTAFVERDPDNTHQTAPDNTAALPSITSGVTKRRGSTRRSGCGTCVRSGAAARVSRVAYMPTSSVPFSPTKSP